MKICLLIPSLVAGGAERVMTRMANHWAENSYEIHIITLDYPGSSPFYDLSPKIKLIQLGVPRQQKFFFKPFFMVRQIVSVLQTVNKIQPDALIAFLDITIFISLVIKPFISAKVIVSERNNPYLNETNPVIKHINHFLYRIADQLILQTERISASFPPRLQSKITVIPNPVPKPEVEKFAYSEKKAEYTIISVGRLKKQKGYDFLIKVFASLGTQAKMWSLVIVGEGEERGKLEQLCKDEQVEERVKFLGKQYKPEKILKEADVYILSSRFEGFPNSLCEAMSIGLPCIATRCLYGPEEIIEHGVNGLLIDVNSQKELRSAMNKLIDSAQLRQQLGEEAKKISGRLSLPNIMRQWEHVIRKVL